MPETSEGKVLRDTPLSIFVELVRSALATRRVSASPSTEHYLVHLLSGFVRTSPDSFGKALGPALLAASRLDPVRKGVILKQLGDTTLFLTGVFLDHIETRPAATEYYFEIGRTAYGRLADVTRSTGGVLGAHVETFSELSRGFVEFVHVLSSIADNELFSSNDRLMIIYQRWLDTGNSRDASRLISAGIIPAGNSDNLH